MQSCVSSRVQQRTAGVMACLVSRADLPRLVFSLLADGAYHLSTIDEFADRLLTEERVCEIQLPRLTQRKVLEETEGLPPRRSKLGRAMGVLDRGTTTGGVGGDAEDGAAGSDDEDEGRSDRYLSRSPSASPSPEPEGGNDKTPEYWTEGSEDEDEQDVATTSAGAKVTTTARRRNSEGSQEEGRYISRSPSPNGSDAGRFVSRSPTPGSPGPNSMAMDVDTERIDGDV